MKIKKLILENFRCFYGVVEIPINDFTVFIGKNDQGKTTILEAIDIFINEGKGAVKIEANDLNKTAKNAGKEIFRIGIVFKDIPENLVIDATNPTTLKDEYLLNFDGDLEIWKTFKGGKTQEKETFLKCYHPVNDDFIKDLTKKKVKELQVFVKENNIDMSSLDQRKSADLRKAIRDHYIAKDGKLNLELVEIKIDEEGVKEIWQKLQNYLPVYALFHSDRKNIDQDEEIQDPLKVKIEQIFKEQDIQNQLNDIAKRIDNEIKKIADKTVEKFNALTNRSLSIDIKPNIPEVGSLKWKDVYKGIGFNTNNDIPLNKRGSGVRRIVLVSSFIAELENKTSQNSNNHIIYAIEEPETSLHPNLQIKLIDALKKLSESENYQVLLSTHSPALIRVFEIDSINYVEQENGITKVESFNESVVSKIVENLGLLPNIGKVVICVEGKNDEEFLLNINQNIPELKNIIDLKEKIDAGLIAIIPMNGSNLKDWINKYALKNTKAIEFHLYDRDDDEKYKESIDKVNAREDGSKAILTNKREIENYIPRELIEQEFKISLDKDNIDNWDNEDIPKKILEKLSKNRNEIEIKRQLCCSVSKKITKKHLEDLKAWDEIEGWFNEIKEIFNKIN